MKGALVTLEGLDGSGKATQAGLLEQELLGRGIELRRVSFPEYGEESSALARMYLEGAFGTKPEDVNAYAASSFFAVDRYASFHRRWRADYAAGKLILTDRYTTSNIVYQMPKLPRNEWDAFITWAEDFEYVRLGIPRPDLTVYLDMPTEISQGLLRERYRKTGGSRDVHERDLAYLASCRQSAVYAAQKLGWRAVDCAEGGKPRSVESIHEELTRLVLDELFSLGQNTEAD